MHIIISPNAFKHSVRAAEAALAIQKGLQQSKLNFTSECFPIADGGDGTAELITRACGGTLKRTNVQDPLGRIISATFGFIDEGQTAVVDMATASGIHLLKRKELNPLKASSFGSGELIKIAINKGVTKVVLGIGGSATMDCGLGILEALGLKIFDKNGSRIKAIPENLIKISSIESDELIKKCKKIEWIILCDVKNKLMGDESGIRTFGPQKGASETMLAQIEDGIKNFSEVCFKHTGRNIAEVQYGGAAGGTAAGLYGLLNAKLENGTDYFLTVTNYDDALNRADLLITGEGSIDLQTLEGKGPFGVAWRAKKLGIPVIGMAGKVPIHSNPALETYFDVLLPISHQNLTLKESIQLTTDNLIRTSFQLGNLLQLKKSNTSVI